jgi:CheY-like chemotaxis protein
MPPLLLLVEDSPEVALIVRRLARYAGQELVCRTDVASAWDYLLAECGVRSAECRSGNPQCRGPDLVLLDWNLPGASGLELCRHVRGEPATRGLTVALFTSGAMTEDITAALEAGVDCVVAKDLLAQPEAWQQRLGELLAGRSGRWADDSLNSWQTPPSRSPSGRDILQDFNKMLRQDPLRQLGVRVVRLLVERALTRVRQRCPGWPATVPPGEWLLPGGVGVDLSRLAADYPGEDLAVVAAALQAEMEYVFGSVNAK